MSNILHEGRYPGEILVSEGGAGISREKVTLKAHSETYASGEVLSYIVATRKYTHLAPAASDGSEIAAAVLIAGKDATAGDVPAAALARMCQVKADLLVWPAGITNDQKTAALDQLAARTIVART
jgi:hypothetical protein